MNYTLVPKKASNLKHIFDVMTSICLWKDNELKLFEYFMFYGSEIQLICIILFAQYHYLANEDLDPLAYFLNQLSEYLTGNKLLVSNYSDQVFRGFELACILYLSGAIIIFFAVLIERFWKGRLSRLGYYYSVYYSKFQVEIGFVPVVSIYLYSVRHRQNLEVFFGLSNSNAGMKIILILMSSIHFLNSFLVTYLCFDPVKTNNLFCSRDTKFQFLSCIIKSLSIILFTISDNKNIIMSLFLAFSSLILLIRRYSLASSFPFYKRQAMIPANVLVSVQLFMVLVTVLVVIISGIEKASPMKITYIQLACLPIIIKLTLKDLDRKIQEALAMPISKIKNERDALKKYFAYSYIIEDSQFNSKASNSIGKPGILQLFNDFEQFGDFLEDPVEEFGFLLNFKERVHKFYTKLTSNMFAQIMKNIKQNSYLKILYANQVLRNEQNFTKAYKIMASIKNKELGFRDNIVYKHIMNHIEEKIHQVYMSNINPRLNFKRVVEIEDITNDLTMRILNSTNRYLKFWEIFKTANFMMSELCKSAEKLEEEGLNIERIWKYIENNYKKECQKLIPTYAAYLWTVRNKPHSSQKLQNQMIFTRIDNSKQDFPIQMITNDINTEKTTVFSIAISKENLGTVLYVSRNVFDLVQMTKQELQGAKVMSILPHYTHKFHYHLWNNLIEDPEFIVPRLDERRGFIKTRDGTLKPVVISINVSPYVIDDLAYICLVQPEVGNSQYMIIADDGRIEGFTTRLANMLNLQASKEYHFKDIFLQISFNEILSQNVEKSTTLVHETNRIYCIFTSRTKSLSSKTYYQIEFLKLQPLHSLHAKEKVLEENVLENSLVIPDEMNPITHKNTTTHIIRMSPLDTKYSDSNTFVKNENETENSGISLKIMKKNKVKELEVDAASVSSLTSDRAKSKLEEIIFSEIDNKMTRLLMWIGLAYTFFCTVSLIGIVVVNKSRLDSTAENTELLIIGSQRLFSTMRVFSLGRSAAALHDGAYTPNRFAAFGIPNYAILVASTAKSYPDDLYKYNILFKDALQSIDVRFHTEFYKKIPLTLNKRIERYADSFTVINYLINTARTIGGSISDLSKVIDKINDLLDNCLDDLLLVNENIFDVLIENTRLLLKRNSDLVWIFFGIMTSFALGIIIFLLYQIVSIIQNRNRFFEAFLRITDQEIESSLDKASKLQFLLNSDQGHFNNTERNLTAISIKSYKSKAKANNNPIKTRRYKAHDSVNNRLKKCLFGTFSWSLVFILSILLIRVVSSPQEKQIKENFQRGVDLNKLLSSLYLLVNIKARIVMLEKNFTVRHQDPDIALNNIQEVVSVSQDLLMKIYDGTKNETIREYLSGNLCLTKLSTWPVSLCSNIVSSSLTKGLMPTTSFLTKQAKILKASYDVSNHTIEAKRMVLNSVEYTEMEVAYGILFTGFNEVLTDLKLTIHEKIRNSITPVFKVAIPSIIIFVLIAIPFWINIVENIRRESILWKKMMHQIPHDFIQKNKFLKTHLIKHSKVQFDSIYF